MSDVQLFIYLGNNYIPLDKLFWHNFSADDDIDLSCTVLFQPC